MDASPHDSDEPLGAGRAAPDPGSSGADAGPTPIWISRRLQVALVAGVVALLIAAVWLVPGILAIVVGAVAIALILSFPVGWMSRVMPRGLAVLVALLVLLGVIAVALAVLVPRLIDQLTQLIAAWPDIQDTVSRMVDNVERDLRDRGLLPAAGPEQSSRLRQELDAWVRGVAASLLAGLADLAGGAFGFLIRLVAVVTVAIYLLLDVRRLRDAFIDLAPEDYRDDAAELWDSFGNSISRYLGGVVLIGGITGVASGVTLWALGVPYALLLGAWVAFTSLIPIFGTYLGVVPALPLALTQSPTTALLTLLTYVIIQQVQDNVLTPRVQGQTARVHPILVLLTVFWVGSAFGLFWSVVAVPALVVVRVLFDFFRVRLRVRPSRTAS